jgi:hypothetical protein
MEREENLVEVITVTIIIEDIRVIVITLNLMVEAVAEVVVKDRHHSGDCNRTHWGPVGDERHEAMALEGSRAFLIKMRTKDTYIMSISIRTI